MFKEKEEGVEKVTKRWVLAWNSGGQSLYAQLTFLSSFLLCTVFKFPPITAKVRGDFSNNRLSAAGQHRLLAQGASLQQHIGVGVTVFVFHPNLH